jgi:hypothetical protein
LALYRFLFAPVLLAIAALVAPAPAPRDAPPPPAEQRADVPARPGRGAVPAARERAETAGPIRAE